MHHMTVKTKSHGDVEIHHNSDWSGEVIVVWTHHYQLTRLAGTRIDSATERREVSIPGEILLALGKAAAKESLGAAMVRLVEGW